MIYKMLLHCKSICSAHNFICSVGKAGVILDHLIDEQTANQRDFRAFPKVTRQARSWFLIIYFLIIHATWLWLRSCINKKIQLICSGMVGPRMEYIEDLLLEVRKRMRELPDVGISSNPAMSQNPKQDCVTNLVFRNGFLVQPGSPSTSGPLFKLS